jgi:[citrate (pro-3S)-lyase] ligase
VTEVYNSKLRELMKKSSLESRTVERLEQNGIPVSASVVRRFLTEDQTEEAYGMIPENTVKYLESEEGKELIWRMKRET